MGDHDYDNSSAPYVNFKESYKHRFASEPTVHSIAGFETVMLLKDALLKSRPVTAENIKNQLILVK